MTDQTITDPLGRKITLHDRTWYAHILKRHAELRRSRELVEQAIQNPRGIRISTYDQDCRTYYGKGPRDGIIVAVVIDVEQLLVRTAFLTDRMKGAVEWSPPTP